MNVIEVTALTKCYGNRRAVDSASFTIAQGELACVVGSNGAGKSTLLRMLAGLVRPTSGTLRVFGERYDAAGHKLYSRIGALIAPAQLYSYLTAQETLEMVFRLRGLRATSQHIEELLSQVGLLHVQHQRVGTFSSGMMQRLAIGVAIVGRPELLILDEPLNGLDPIGVVEFRHLLMQLRKQGVTILLSSHILAEIENLATYVIALHEGRLIAVGPTQVLLEQSQCQVIIEAEQQASMVQAVLLPDYPSELLTPHSLAVNASAVDIPIVVQKLVEHGIHVRAILPRRSLEQFYVERLSYARTLTD